MQDLGFYYTHAEDVYFFLKNNNYYLHCASERFFFRGAPVPPIVSPDTPIGEAAQPIEGRSTRSLSMPLDRGRATDASLQTEARKKPVPPHRDNRGLWTADYLVR